MRSSNLEHATLTSHVSHVLFCLKIQFKGEYAVKSIDQNLELLFLVLNTYFYLRGIAQCGYVNKAIISRLLRSI